MTAAGLAKECDVFTRYLSGHPASTRVSERYAEAHQALDGMQGGDGHERWLLRVARTGPGPCRVADAWARLAAPHGVLRQKLVVLLAILEVTPPYAAELDQPRGGPALEWVRMAASGLGFAGALVLGVVLFLPVRLAVPRKTG